MQITGKQKILSLAGLALAVGVAFGPALFNGFAHWDDPLLVVTNPLVTSPGKGRFFEIFTTMVGKSYTPLTIGSFALEHRFFGLDPFFYHLDNLLLHFAVAALVWWLGLRLDLSRRAAFLAALLFAVHPMRVESVAWISERKDVLYALFYLGAVLLYLSYQRSGRFGAYVGGILFGLASVLAKSMAVSLPLVLWWMDWYRKRPFSRHSWLDKLPFLLIAAGFAGVTYVFNERLWAGSLGGAVLVWIWSLVFYLRTFAWPADLSPLYNVPLPVSLLNGEYLVALGIFVLWILSLWFLRRDRLWLFASGYFVLSIFFLLRFRADIMTSAVADRFMYLPALGFCLWAGYQADRVLRWSRWTGQVMIRTVIPVMLAGMFLLLGLATFRQCRLWGDELAFWEKAVRRAPGYVSYINLAQCWGRRGRYDQALLVYQKALGQDKARDHWIYNDIGMTYLSLNDSARALESYNRSLALNGQCAETYLLRAFLYQRLGKYGEALGDYTRTIELETRLAQAYHNRALMYYLQGRFDPAIDDLGRVVELVPDFLTAYYFRGQIYGMRGERTKALQDCEAVLRIEPRHPGALALRSKLGEQPFKPLPRVLDVPDDTFRRPQWDPFAYKNHLSDRERIYNLTSSANESGGHQK